MSSAAKGTLAPPVAGAGLWRTVALASSAKKSLCVCVLLQLFCSVLEFTAGISLLILLRSSNNPPPFLLTKVITGAEWCFFPPCFYLFFLPTALTAAAVVGVLHLKPPMGPPFCTREVPQVRSCFKWSDSRTPVQNECWPKTLVMSCRRY